MLLESLSQTTKLFIARRILKRGFTLWFLTGCEEAPYQPRHHKRNHAEPKAQRQGAQSLQHLLQQHDEFRPRFAALYR